MERQRDVRGLSEPAAPAALAGTLPARYTHVGTAAGHPTEGGCRLWRRVRGRLRTRKWVGGGGVPLGSPLRRPNEPCWDGSARGGGGLWALPSGSVPDLRWESGSEVAANSAVLFLLVF